ncbi:MAG: hypothetical protein AAB635_00575 [Patescibacteria group bacterium]
MTLATHIVTGAAVAKIFTANPVQAFLVGCLSHYVLDSIIHWDYKLRAFSSESNSYSMDDSSSIDDSFSMEKKVRFNKFLLGDIAKVLFDAFLGFLIVFLIVSLATDRLANGDMFIMLFGAVGGVIPDFLQFLYGIRKNQFLRGLQKFHHFMHAKRKLNDRPVLGISLQIFIIVAVGLFLSGSFLWAQ